ncbi:MAG: 2-amino-4-hydroxy-6-hydroxymethyldihydropteridine diphosphokinase [Bacteroidota bacterium]
MARAFVGVGSNLGDRSSQLQKALDACRMIPLTTFVRSSSVYETSPVGTYDQPQFLNAVIELSTALDPGELLKKLKKIEKDLGRTDAARWAPRTIDLDILLYDDVVVMSDELTIPHPHMMERKFVLVPLVELDSAVVHPIENKTVDAILAGCSSMERIVRYPLALLME